MSLLLVIAHYGQPPRKRLGPIGAATIGVMMAILPILLVGGPPVIDVVGAGPFAAVEFLFRVGLVFVTGLLFGVLGFIAYEVTTGLPETDI